MSITLSDSNFRGIDSKISNFMSNFYFFHFCLINGETILSHGSFLSHISWQINIPSRWVGDIKSMGSCTEYTCLQRFLFGFFCCSLKAGITAKNTVVSPNFPGVEIFWKGTTSFPGN